MNARKLQQLFDRAAAAHVAGRHTEEAALWRQIYLSRPHNDHVLSNLASAEMEAGRLDEAQRLFESLLRRNPKIARAVNNQAKLRLRLGAELQDVFPEFLLALELSESADEVCWHVVNLCQCAAFGWDHVAAANFALIRARISELVDARWPDDHRAIQKAFLGRVVDAYSEMAAYRKAIAERDWGTANQQLDRAKAEFENAGLENFASGVDNLYADLLLCRNVFGLLEDIARDQSFDAAGAHARAGALLKIVAGKLATKNVNSHRRLYEVLHAFLSTFTVQLEYLSAGDRPYESPSGEAQAALWLTGATFRSMCDEFLGISRFTGRRCRDLSAVSSQLASRTGVMRAASGEWAKLALYLHGRVLDYREIDVALARAALGWSDDALLRVRADLHEFRAFVERQAHKDLFVEGKPQENIARALLQARLTGRSYREVAVRGGRSDVLLFERNGSRILVEAKIWRGEDYHEQGKRELAEYIAGENDDRNLLAAFYVVFDPTKSARAIELEGSSVATDRIDNVTVETVIVRIRPVMPSRSKASPS